MSVNLNGPIRRCRSCDQSVIWVTTEEGKKMPVDYLPVADGNLIALSADTVRYANKAATPVPGQIRYKSHFATCPERDSWRKSA